MKRRGLKIRSASRPLEPGANPKQVLLRTVLAGALLVVVAGGCSMLSYTGPSGEEFSRFSLGTKTAIAALSVETGTNGIRRLELQGYQNDSNQALSTVTEAAIRAALSR